MIEPCLKSGFVSNYFILGNLVSDTNNLYIFILFESSKCSSCSLPLVLGQQVCRTLGCGTLSCSKEHVLLTSKFKGEPPLLLACVKV